MPYRTSGTLEIDQSSRRSLEITRTIREGRREGSLLAVLDRTVDGHGLAAAGRLAGQSADRRGGDRRPARGRRRAGGRAGAGRRPARDALRRVYDVERLLARVTTGRASPRDLSFLGRTLRRLPALKAKLTARKQPAARTSWRPRSTSAPSCAASSTRRLADDCPLASRDGGFIRDGFHAELDALRELARGGKQWIARYQAEEIAADRHPNLKVGFNKVFGYYIEITNAHREKIPADYIRKQTVKNAERYITPELKEYEEKVLTADEKAKELEYELFLELRDAVAAARRRMQATAAVLAELDVLVALAELARQRNYCRPEIVEEPVLRIIDGRHPVLDVLEPEGHVRAQRHRWPAADAGNDPADHRPEHGGQEHVHPPGGPDHADGPDRQLRAGPRGDDRRGRPHFRPRRRQRRADPRPEHVHGRDDRDGPDPQHGHAAEPGDPRRDRPRHEHLRRHLAGLVGGRAPARPHRLPHAVRHALPRADRPGEVAVRA